MIKVYVLSRWLQKRREPELTVMDSMMLGSVEDPLQGTKIIDQLLGKKKANCKHTEIGMEFLKTMPLCL